MCWALLRNGWVIEPSCLAGTVSLRICHKLTTKQDQPFLHALPNPDPFCAKNLHSPTRPWEGCVYKWYWVPSRLDILLILKYAICSRQDLVRFPDPLRKWVGRTNPSRPGNFTLKASSSEKGAGTPPRDTHRWILQHLDNAWELSKLGKVNSCQSGNLTIWDLR